MHADGYYEKDNEYFYCNYGMGSDGNLGTYCAELSCKQSMYLTINMEADYSWGSEVGDEVQIPVFWSIYKLYKDGTKSLIYKSDSEMKTDTYELICSSGDVLQIGDENGGANFIIDVYSYSTTHQPDTTFTAPEWAIGDEVSLVNNNKYDKCAKITSINHNEITLDSLPFTEILIPDEIAFDDYTILNVAKPTKGVIDFGMCSHAEGSNNQVINYEAHVEGSWNIAYGRGAHAEGMQNEAAYCSHAEGRLNKAKGTHSHAEGYLTVAENTNTHTEGRETFAGGYAAHAEGLSSKATGDESHAEGIRTEAAGQGSHAEGYETAVYKDTTYGHAEGNQTKVSANGAHAEGYKTEAGGKYSHTEGYQSKVLEGIGAHAEGHTTTVEGQGAHAEGVSTYAKNEAAHAEGYRTEASGMGAHAEGNYNSNLKDKSGKQIYTISSGKGAHAEGNSTTASGEGAHSEGNGSSAIGNYSHAEGNQTKVYGRGAHAEGYNTEAGLVDGSAGHYSHAEGNNTKAQANNAHAEGTNTTASKEAAHAEGYYSIASGNYSHAGGKYTIASAEAQTAIGKYNKENADALFIVGDGTGTDASKRRNVFEVISTSSKRGIRIGDSTILNAEDLSILIANINYIKRIAELEARIVALESGATLIKFTIEGKEYAAEEGMTFYEWCQSGYAPSNAECESEDDQLHVDGYPIESAYGYTVIEDGAVYYNN